MAKGKQDAASLLTCEAETRRPFIHHLNADTSWLIQIPRNDDHPRPYFNLLIDPWLTTSQIEFSRFFHEQAHTVPSAFQTIAEIESFIQAIENRACTLQNTPAPSEPPDSYIDAVACSLSLTDHVHEPTLRQLHPSVPLLVCEDALYVKKWNHFTTIAAIPPFQRSWQTTTLPSLPSWLGIGSLAMTKDLQGIHKGLVVSFSSPRHPTAEAIVYMPHGIPAEQMDFLRERDPPLRVLALLHGLLNVKVGLSWLGYSDANLGAHNGLKLQRLLEAEYWAGTHDEMKVEKGFTSWILTQNPISLEEALEREREECGQELARPNWRDVGNGGSLVLV